MTPEAAAIIEGILVVIGKLAESHPDKARINQQLDELTYMLHGLRIITT